MNEAIVLRGDCLRVLASLPSGSVDAIVCDPPYGLGFMGKEWDTFAPASVQREEESRTRKGTQRNPNGAWAHKDGTGQGGGVPIRYDPSAEAGRRFGEWCRTWAAEALRVAKPGAHILVCGGPRTFHRMTAGLEDAGWEIRDVLSWNFGSGFPKSLDVAKAIDKAARGAPQGGPDPASPAHGQYKGGCSEESPSGRGFGAGPGRFMRRGVEDREYAVATGVGLRNRCATCDKPFFSADPCRCPKPAPVTQDGKKWAGWGTALKPAWEPIVLARKPLEGTVAENVLTHGTGGLNVDGCRIATPGEENPSIERRKGSTADCRPGEYPESEGRMGKRTRPEVFATQRPGEALGRWPANVALDEEAAALMDGQVGVLRSGLMRAGQERTQDGGYHGGFPMQATARDTYADEGGPSRFFYCAKASRSEREEGLEAIDPVRRTDGREDLDGPGADNPRLRSGERRNDHPTVKPLDLMRWLVRLVTPPGGVVLDPFTGSGTTGVAAIREGFDFLGIEREERYCAIAEARIRKALADAKEIESTPGLWDHPKA